MELAKIVADSMLLLDEAMKIVTRKIVESKDQQERQGYEDYRRHIRELGSSIYTLIGKMRMDRILDPDELVVLDQMAAAGLKIAEERQQ